MAPYPEELDVFSAPHSRMKQLVEGYSNKVSCTDFSSHDATEALLRCLYSTFTEFKSHETIENEFIMQQLRCRLRDLEVNEHESVVCNCHSDNRLSEMLGLVRAGYSYNNKSSLERIRYGQRLEAALDDFTKTFLPHMEEEEEIFQPMLVKYFAYEELKTLKEAVIEEHKKLKPTDSEEDNRCEQLCLEEDCLPNEEYQKHTKHKKEPATKHKSPFETLPPEITTKIFSYLRPPDLGRCSRVCNSWRSLTHQPVLWRSIFPTVWARGEWDSDDGECIPECEQFWSSSCSNRICETCFTDEICDLYGDEYNYRDGERHYCRWSVKQEEGRILKGIRTQLLPLVRMGVRHLSFAGSEILDRHWLSTFIEKCPNLLRLDLSYTLINDDMLQSLTPCSRTGESSKLHGFCPHIIHLSLDGCDLLTDAALAKLLTYLFHPPTPSSSTKLECKLTTLSLSGCHLLTDQSLRFLLHFSKSLCDLDLSGCKNLTGPALCSFVEACPTLAPEMLSYCDGITDGPYQDEAYGCQNLACPTRFCCSNGH